MYSFKCFHVWLENLALAIQLLKFFFEGTSICAIGMMTGLESAYEPGMSWVKKIKALVDGAQVG